ncbi:MAG: PorV/PorQ family protein [bacterium]
MRTTFIGILAVMISSSLFSQTYTKVGTTAAQFLKIPVGAKAASMANTYSSVADNATAMYWNASGIAQLDRMQVSISHSSWLAGLTHAYAGIVIPAGGKSAVGLSGIALQSGKIEQTTIERPEGTGVSYDALDFALGLTYARSMTEYVDIGATVKYINQRIWSETAHTVAVDFGALLRTGFKDLTIGLSFQNFGPGLSMAGRELIRQLDQDPASTANPYVQTNLQTQEWDLPTSYRVSTSISLIGDNGITQIPNSRFILALDAAHPTDNPEHYSIGGEYEFAGTIAIRGGYAFQTDEEGLTLGVGLKLPVQGSIFSFDYGYAAFGVLGSVQYVTLNVMF